MFTTQQSISLDRQTKQSGRKFRASLYSKLLGIGGDSNAAVLAAEAIAAREVLGIAVGDNQGISLLQDKGIDLSQIEFLTEQVWQELELPCESTEVATTSAVSERSTFPQREQQKIRELVEGLEKAQAATDATVQECRKLVKRNASTPTAPSVRQPWEILPQQNWNNLSQEQLLGWAQVAIECSRQGWSLWEAMLEYNLQDDLGFDDYELMLPKNELLEIATWTINRAKEVEIEMEVVG